MKRFTVLIVILLGIALCTVKAEDSSLSGKADLVLPPELATVREQAFFGIAAQSVYLRDRVTEIQAQAFADCKTLGWVRIPPSVERIADDAFQNCPVGMKIYGVRKSKAQEYAYQKGFPFFDELTGEEIKPDTLPDIPIL